MAVSFQKEKQLSDYYTIVLVSFPLGECVDEIDDSQARYEEYRYDVHFLGIVGKGGYTSLSRPPPFSRSISPFFWDSPLSRNPRYSPPFTVLSGKQKHQITIVTNLYIISTLKVSWFWKIVYKSGEIQAWYNVFKCFLVNLMKRGCHLEKGIRNFYLKLSLT